jgi:hypothetical protein
MEGYKTLADYKSGKAANFKNSEDYEKSKSQGIEDTEFFYYCERNSFRAPEDAEDAYKNGFVLYTTLRTEKNYMSGQKYTRVTENTPRNQESETYYNAKKLDFTNYADYKEYLDYTAKGFRTKDEYLDAKAKGFSNAEDEKNAREAGFTNNEEYSEAKRLGLKTESDYVIYKEITREIDRIIYGRKIPKKYATVYYFIQGLPKSECAISVLSKTLTDAYNANSTEVKNALDSYFKAGTAPQKSNTYFNTKRTQPQINSIANLFSESQLKEFFTSTDISALGSYSSQSEIFKKK